MYDTPFAYDRDLATAIFYIPYVTRGGAEKSDGQSDARQRPYRSDVRGAVRAAESSVC
jgi:hypothetical protein